MYVLTYAANDGSMATTNKYMHMAAYVDAQRSEECVKKKMLL